MFLFSSIERPGDVHSALQHASRSTGVGFDYLLKTAERESSLDPQARASTSSARGLFQFLDSTWLSIFREAGPRHGYGELAGTIERGPRGGYTVTDPALRDRILDLRNDPSAAALMAGEFTRRNADALTAALGRTPGEGELYIAHFLGAQGATHLLRLAVDEPDTPAAAQFPQAARANRAVFYAGDGRERSIAEVHANLVARHSATAGRQPESVPGTSPEGDGGMRAFAPMRRNADHAFHGIFADTGAGLGPMARAVSGFWSGMGGDVGKAVADASAPLPPQASAGDASGRGGTAGAAPEPTAFAPAEDEGAPRARRVDMHQPDPALPLPPQARRSMAGRLW